MGVRRTLVGEFSILALVAALVGVSLAGVPGMTAPASADPLPQIQATSAYNPDRVDGVGLAPDTTVTLTVNGVPVSDPPTTDGFGSFYYEPSSGFDLESGDVVVVDDGVEPRSLALVGLTFDTVDRAADTASGTSDQPDGTEVGLWLVNQTTYEEVATTVTGGTWTAVFTIDVTSDTWGQAAIVEPDGDGTYADAPAVGAETGPVQWSPADGGNGHWYQLSPRPVEGMEDAIQLAAETTLMGQPGYVVSVLSEGEKDFLVETFGSEEQYVIGITDEEFEGVWEWVSGEPSGYTFWASGEPNDYMGEDYAVMNWQHEPNPEVPEPPGAWNDLGGAYGIAIFEYDAMVVSVDIRPGSDVNPINPRAKGVVPVAILTTDTFDATTVDHASVVFGPDAAAKAHKYAHVVDVDYDGDLDLLFHFAVAETGIASGDTAACLEGYTYDGLFLTGCDSLTTVPAG